MSEKPEPITTQFTNKDQTVSVGGNPLPAEDPADQQKIKVRALRSFHEEAGMKGRMLAPGSEFDCPRLRAAQLRANGLIEYVSADDEKNIHGEAGAKELATRIKRRADLDRSVDQHKTTPLRNPEVKLADVPGESSKK